MPIFIYRCPTCEFTVERIELTPNPDAPTCERCATEHDTTVEMSKQPTAGTPVFRGSGWCRPSTYQPPRRGSDL